MNNRELIDELKRRGYRVYPETRVRIYGAQHIINRSNLVLSRRIAEDLRNRALEEAAMQIGLGLLRSNVLVRSVEDVSWGEQHRVQVAVVLPKGWDFEAEMWGAQGDLPAVCS